MLKNQGGWIQEENLLPFLLILSRMASYDFDQVDWKAIQFGLSGTHYEGKIWFNYILPGEHDIEIRLAKEEGTALVFFDVAIPEELECKFDFMIDILQEFSLKSPNFISN
jgi:hypothetical protein